MSVTADEIMRRGCKLGYDVEIHARRRRGVMTYHVSIYDYSPTAQAGYEYPRVFVGNLPGALGWIEERERRAAE